MIKRILAVFVMTIVLGLSMGLVGCGMPDAVGYQGDLEDGSSFVYIELDDTVMVSIVDDEHQGDDAETYSGKAKTDAAGKITVTDDETGNSISLTMTEGADDTFDVDVQGHGKGTLKPYEGDIMSVISSMATDDAESEEEAEE